MSNTITSFADFQNALTVGRKVKYIDCNYLMAGYVGDVTIFKDDKMDDDTIGLTIPLVDLPDGEQNDGILDLVLDDLTDDDIDIINGGSMVAVYSRPKDQNHHVCFIIVFLD